MTLAVYQGVSAADVSLTATVTVDNEANHQAGLIARYQSAGDYYAGVVAYTQVGGQWGYYAWIYHYTTTGLVTIGEQVLLTEITTPTALQIRFEAVGDQLSLWVNGALRISETDTSGSALSGPGEVGFLAYNDPNHEDDTLDDFNAFSI
jgi:hypothetical protein